MKTLRAQILIATGILFIVIGTIAVSTIFKSIEEKKSTEVFHIKNSIAGYLNTAARYQAIERGLGATILGGGDLKILPKFLEMGNKGDAEVLLAEE